MSEEYNKNSMDTLCAALAAAMDIPAPAQAAAPNEDLMAYLAGRKADRLFMYNPDAIGEWIWRKYPQLFKEVSALCEVEVIATA